MAARIADSEVTPRETYIEPAGLHARDDRSRGRHRVAVQPRRCTSSAEAVGIEPRRVASRHQPSDGPWTAFEAEAMPHVDRLFRLAMWLERDRAKAEDLVQDTMIQALTSFHRYRPGTNCRAWLVTILHNLRSNRRRANRRMQVVEDRDNRIADTVPFVPPISAVVTDEDFLIALRGIPEHHQNIIMLCDVEELTYKEIATALRIPIGTVMSRLHRGRAMLRQQLILKESGVSLTCRTDGA